MTITESPKRRAAAHIVAEAEARLYANPSMMVRHEMVTMALVQARQEGYGGEPDEEICTAYGFHGTGGYWEVALSEPMKATSFTHLLALHQIDPTERLNAFDPRSKAQQLLDAALRRALEAEETFFIKGDKIGNALLRPRDATLWLLSLPRRRDLVPPALRAFLEQSAASTMPPPSGSRTNREVTAEEKCTQWLAGLPAEPHMRRGAALAAAKQQFQPLSDKAFGRAWDPEARKKGWNKPGRPKKTPPLITTS